MPVGLDGLAGSVVCGVGRMEAAGQVLLDAGASIEAIADGWTRLMREKTYRRMLLQRPG